MSDSHWSTEAGSYVVGKAVESVAGETAGEIAREVMHAALDNEEVVDAVGGGWGMVRGGGTLDQYDRKDD